MATIRNKIYKTIGNNTYYVPLVRGQNTTSIVAGTDDGSLVHAIPYGQGITTQGILELAIDLIENDTAINNEINGINRIISEGVLASPDFQFDFDFRYASQANGTVIMTSGHNWSSVNQTFVIRIITAGSAGAPITITLNANCTTAQQVIDEINAELTAAMVNDYVEAALDSFNRVYFRGVVTTDPPLAASYNGFILNIGSPDALATLGIKDTNGATITAPTTFAGNLKEVLIDGGVAKLHETPAVYGVYEIPTSQIFYSPSIHTTNWYRRDLINIVFKDINNPDDVPYLEYEMGEESSIILPRKTIYDKSVSSTKNTYPLWSILFRNNAGIFEYIEHDQAFAFGGLSENVKVIGSLAFQKADHGFYASLHDDVTFTMPDGTLLPADACTSSTQTAVDKATFDLETACADDPTGKLSFQEPDVEFRDDLAYGDLLTIPFKLEEYIDDYAVAQDVELNEFTIPLDTNTIAEEGLEVHIYTAKYFVNDYNNGVIGISGVSVSGGETTLTLDLDIYEFTQLTGNNIDFETPSPFVGVEAGDFIFVCYGLGLYQVSEITQVVDGTHIKLYSVPIAPDVTSKILIYKTSTVELVGNDIDSAFLGTQTYDDQIKYSEQYPFSTHSGISAIPWFDATYGYQEFGLAAITAAVDTGLDNTGATTYTIGIAINGAASVEYSITPPNSAPVPYTYGDLVGDLNSATPGITFEIIEGDVRCSSDSVGPTSTILFAAGSVNDLFVALGTTFNANPAVDGVNVESNYAILKGDVDLSAGHDWSAINQTFDITITIDGTPIALKTILLSDNCVSVSQIITHINSRFEAAGIDGDVEAYQYVDNGIAFRTIRQGADQGILVGTGGVDALATLGLDQYHAIYTAGTFPDIDQYYKAALGTTTRLFYHMPAAPGTFEGHPKVTFPFKVRLNYNQWYFARVSVRNRDIPYADYGSRPKIVVMDRTWAGASATALNTYFNAQILTNPGLYLYQVDGVTMFQIEDAYGDITVPQIARHLKGFPYFYTLYARNLNGSAFIEPTTDGDVYIDPINGIVTFKDAPSQRPPKIYLTYYYNSVVTGSLWTDNVFHEKTSGEVWNLQTLIEELINPITSGSSGSTTAVIDITPFELDPVIPGGTAYDFQPGTVIRYDVNVNSEWGWCKAQASNFHYVGDAMVLQRISDTSFQIISLGYIDTIGTISGGGYTATITDELGNDLEANTIYYLSETYEGRITKNKPAISQPILFTFTDNVGVGVEKGLVILLTKANFLEIYNINQQLTQKCVDLSNQSDQLTKQIMELATSVSFIGGRVSQDSDYIMDTFASKEMTSINALINIAKPALIKDENDYNNNWYETADNQFFKFKQGALAPRRTTFMGEVINKYDLTTIGLTYKAGISYDETNQCYWLMTNSGGNAAGMILQLVLDGVLNIKGFWHLPAGGNAALFWTGIHSDGTHLYFTLNSTAPAGGVESVLFKASINSDGSLAQADDPTAGLMYSGHLLAANLTDLKTWSGGAGVGYSVDAVYAINDVCAGSTDDYLYTIALDSTAGAATPHIVEFDKATLTAGTDISCGLIAGTAALYTGRSICKSGNMLYIRIDDVTSNDRNIYGFNLDANVDIKGAFAMHYSCRLNNSVDVDGECATGGNGGICVDQRGDLLEVNSTAANGKLVAQHAMSSSLWAENQLMRKYRVTSPTGGSYATPWTITYGLCVDGDYVWISSNNSVNNGVRLQRQAYKGTTQNTIQINPGSWTYIFGITIATIDGVDYFYFVGYTGAFGAGSFVSRVIARTVVEGAIGGNLDIGTEGAEFTAFPPAGGTIYDITNDGDYLYLLDDNNNKIWRWTLGTVASPPATDGGAHILLPDDVTGHLIYSGLAYSNGKFYVARYLDNASTGGDIIVYSRDKVRDASFTAYQLHRLKYMFSTEDYGAQLSFDDEGNIWQIQGPWPATAGPSALPEITVRKTIEDPDALQVNFFLNSSNVLASNNATIIPIENRYFEPDEFFDIRDCPDKKYTVAYYTIGETVAFSILNLDSFLSGKSSTGKDRYDVSKIAAWNFNRGANCVFYDTGTTVEIKQVVIEKDIIFITYSVKNEDGANATAGTTPGMFIIDLKSGTSWVLGYLIGSTASDSGKYFSGSLSDRNATGTYSYTGVVRADLAITTAHNVYAHPRQISPRTFDKDDLSEYSFLHAKTYVPISWGSEHDHVGGGLDVLVIDWDENNNRSLGTLFTNITNIGTNAGYGRGGCCLTQDGQLYYGFSPAASGAAGAYLRYPKYIWELQNSDESVSPSLVAPYLIYTYGAATYQPYRFEEAVCWRTVTGVWKHLFLVTTVDFDDGGAKYVGAFILDAENLTNQTIFATLCDGTGGAGGYPSEGCCFAALYEDMVFITQTNPGGTGTTLNADMMPFVKFKRLHFDDNSIASANYWSRLNVVNTASSPHFLLTSDSVTARVVKYCKQESIALFGTTAYGIQGFCFPHSDQCEHESIDFDCDNPKYYYYKANVINDGSE